MADSLVLRLPRALEEHATWLVVDPRGAPTGPPQSGPLSLAAVRCAGRRIVVLVPGSEVLLAEPEVPAKAGLKLPQLVPYALEEQLADDIDELHFATGRRIPGSTRVPVAVVARSQMEQWLGVLTQAGIEPDVLAVDSELLPQDPGHSVALLEGDSVVVRAPQGLPLTLPRAALTEALEKIQSPPDMGGGGVRGLNLYSGPLEWHESQAEVDALRERFDGININLLQGGALPLLAQRVPQATLINLSLQGPYARQSTSNFRWQQWRTAAVLLVGLVALHVAGKEASLSLLRSHERQLDTQIRDVFRSVMQQDTAASDARRRMEQRLAVARGVNTGLLAALEAMVQARGSVPGTLQLSSVSYHGGLIDLKLSAPDASSLDRLSAALRNSGWQAELKGGNHGPKGYEGRVQIHTGT